MNSWRPLSRSFTPPLIELSPFLPSLDTLGAQSETDFANIQAWRSSHKDVLGGYQELMLVYEKKCSAFLLSVEKLSQNLVDGTRLSKELWDLLVSTTDTNEIETTENRDDDILSEQLMEEAVKPAVEDEITPRDIQESFFAALERLEKDGLPPSQIYCFPQETKDKFIQWFNEHLEHPFPSKEEKIRLAKETATEISQVNSWFYHRRKRFRKQPAQENKDDFRSPCSDQETSDL
jgi:hypothetical protein